MSRAAQYHCDFCRTDISNIVHIRCAECADFDLCMSCFASGAEVFPHKNNHKYRIVGQVTTPIFDQDWGADEELLLLEAIEMYGLGNWSDVAEHIGTKNAVQCEQHYYHTYLSSQNAPLPDPDAPITSNEKSVQKHKTHSRPKAHASVLPTLPILPKAKLGSAANSVGYLPKRRDFDTEWDNEAETRWAEIDFKVDDSPIEREVKQQLLDIYHSRQEERLARKHLLFERGPVYSQDMTKVSSLKPAEAKTKFLTRFLSPPEHEEFVRGFLEEEQLRQAIAKLQTYRKNGCRTLSEGLEYEAAKGKLNGRKDKKDGKKRAASGAPSGASEKPIRRKKDGPFDISKMEGHELLAQNERELCTRLRLIPRHYLVLKQRVFYESLTRSSLTKKKLAQVLKVEPAKSDELYDFMSRAGWIRPATALLASDPSTSTSKPPSMKYSSKHKSKHTK